MHKNLMIAVVLLALPLGCTHANENLDKSAQRSPGKPSHPIQVEVVDGEALHAGVESEAKIIVRSARDIESMEVTVTPASGMLLKEDRFQRYRPDFVHGVTELPLQFRPASDGPQSMKVSVRATDAAGRIMSRTVDISLGVNDADKQHKEYRNPQAREAQPEADEDAVVKGEQEIRRKN